MLLSLNLDKNDPKCILLSKIFKIIDSKNTRDVLSRNGIKQCQMMVKCIKIFFCTLYFDYKISHVINELIRSGKLRKFFNLEGEVPTADQVYEYLSRYSLQNILKL